MDNQKEIFTVVDKNDRIRGYYSRYQCHHDKRLIHRAVGILIFNEAGQVLLQKRSQNKDTNPGFYTLSVSGHVTKGDTYTQTAKRELFEELGIQSPLRRERKFVVESEIETEMDCIFTAKHNGPFSPNKEEVDKVEFVDLGKLPSISSKLTPFALTSFKQLGLL